MKTNLIENITVRRAPTGPNHRGLLSFEQTVISCSLGKNGISTNKKEGDQATPAGSYKLLYGFCRQDRIFIPTSLLPLLQINENSGWCDDVNHSNYNRPIDLPSNASHETLTRKDRLYDICLVMDHNYTSRIKNRGSAVFFHLINENQGPTQGCIAIDPKHMLQLLPRLNEKTTINIIA